MNDLKKIKLTDFNYSIRRYFVDEFFERNIYFLNDYKPILDVGGKKVNKRGDFNIDNYMKNVKYLNIDPTTNPDYCCDAAMIPVVENYFSGIICSEVLEHVDDPIVILKECYRVLEPGGTMLIAVPFMFHVHSDPYDFARYTDYYWEKNLKRIGFSKVTIENQGSFFAVLANLFKLWGLELSRANTFRIKKYFGRVAIKKIVGYLINKHFEYETLSISKKNKIFSANTLGYGIIVQK